MHAIIRNILTAQPTLSFNDSLTLARIRCNGKGFVGIAELHPEDRDFNSSIVGATIATSRARIHAFKEEIIKAKIELSAKREMYWHATVGMNTNDVCADPLDGFTRSLKSSEKKLQLLRAALRSEEEGLTSYLKSQKEAITKIKGYRAKKDENN